MNNINLSKVNLQAPTQLRLMENQQHIEDLAHAYADNGSFHELPWVAYVKETNEYVPIDGFHRLMAVAWLHEQQDIHTEANTEEVAIRYSEFDTMAEAIIAAAGVNATHGLKRQKGDIQNAIRSLLEVDRIRFMESKFKLNKKAIIEAVKCSSRTYEQETKAIRAELEKQRNITIIDLYEEGKTQREIVERTGTSKGTVDRVLSAVKQDAPNTHDAQTGQSENDDQNDAPNTHDAQTGQEEEPSVFNHITSATVAENPWDDVEQESSNGTDLSEVTPISSQVESSSQVEQSPVNLESDLTDEQLCDLVMGLDARQQDLLRNLLNNM